MTTQTPMYPDAEIVVKMVTEVYERVYVKFALEDPTNYSMVMSHELTEDDFQILGQKEYLEILDIAKDFCSIQWKIYEGVEGIYKAIEGYVPKWLSLRNNRRGAINKEYTGSRRS